MSLYSQNFTFLSPLPRSPLSWGSESTRSQLPDFVNTNELRQFMSSLFVFLFPHPSVVLQMKVGVALLSVVIFLCLVIIIKAIIEKNWWIFRVQKMPTGRIIIPNAILAFHFIETCFIITLITTAVMIQNSYFEGTKKPKNLILWILLPWSTMIFGIFIVILGILHANPSGCTAADLKNHKFAWIFFLRRITNHSITINFITFAIPISAGVSVAIPAILANALQVAPFHRQLEWQSKYQFANQFTQEMITEAQEIWFQTLKSMKVVSIAFCIWSFWGFLSLIIYIYLTVSLLIKIKKELSLTDLHKWKFNVEPTKEEAPQIKLEDITRNDPKHVRFQSQENHPIGSRNADIIDRQNSEDGRGSRIILEEGVMFSMEKCPNLAEEHGSEDPNTTNEYRDDKRRRLRFNFHWFNSKKRKTIQQAEDQEHIPSTCNTQKENLKKAMITIMHQMGIIIPGCAIFTGVSLMLGLTFFGSFEQPRPNRITIYAQIFTGVALLTQMYTIIVLGFLNCFYLLFRVFEQVFVKIKRRIINNTHTDSMSRSGVQERA